MKPEVISEIEISYIPKKSNHPAVKSCNDVYKYLKQFYPDKTIALIEQFTVAFLNRANKIIGVQVVSTGGITRTIANPRLIMASVLKAAATGIINGHNHPSGNLKPSEVDKELTNKIKNASELMDIKLLDHLIITKNGYLSFAENNYF